MGAWGHGAFDNDDASDFSAVLEEAQDPVARLESALAAAADETDYLEIDVACTAIAAAAVVASTLPDGPPLDPSYGPQDLDLPDLSRLAALALRALDRVAADDSEWRELWDETGSLDEAAAVIDEIGTVLQGHVG